tara:strand:- start:18587 stop:19810 length:1224 start_codon:yes stop_codon:yes gene_type:complete
MTKTSATIPIQENDAVYYAGQMKLALAAGQSKVTFNPGDGGPLNTVLISNYNSALVAVTDTANFDIHILANQTALPTLANKVAADKFYVEDSTNNTVNFLANGVAGAGEFIFLQLTERAVENNWGSYSYLSLDDIINNFLMAYIGDDKILQKVKRTDVLFHARRAMQELSYDILPSAKSIESTIPITLTVPLPIDYVNYVRLSWADAQGVLRTIYPLNGLSGNPTELPIDDGKGVPTQSSFGNNLEAAQSIIESRWEKTNQSNISGSSQSNDSNGIYDEVWWKQAYGQRYGLQPELAQSNGYFSVNQRLGSFSFSSNLSQKVIMINYISDGLAVDLDSLVPKMIEEAMYAKILSSIAYLSRNVDGNSKALFKRDAYAKTRNAKIRLSNLKLDEIVQVFRGQSKWIKS